MNTTTRLCRGVRFGPAVWDRASKSRPFQSLAAHSTKAAGTKFAELPKLENRTLSEAEKVRFSKGFKQPVIAQKLYNLLICNKLMGGGKNCTLDRSSFGFLKSRGKVTKEFFKCQEERKNLQKNEPREGAARGEK
ncbi:MAG: hypothetical protein MJZ72_02300 [Bacteroidales bacterium]|nr:hypothetical protein [Bacteroidales bacterium]